MTALHRDPLVRIIFLASLSVILSVFIGKKINGKRGRPSDSESAEEEQQKRKPEEDEAGPSTMPSKQGSFKFDVFISFRGTDTRSGFTSHLHKELTDRGIFAFIDNENLVKGQKISELFKHIEESKIFVPVFSENYADSKWCLMEIAKIVEINKKTGQSRPIIPIFYKVDPSDVRHHRGSFEAAFATHQLNKLDLGKVNDWKAALTEAGKFSGYCLSEAQGITEAKLISIIGEKVSGILNKQLTFHIQTVGIDSRVQHVMEMLGVKNYDGVSVIGIWGQGGMGKTTLAMAIYNKISSEYDGSCFLSDVRESANQHIGLPKLQEKFIAAVLKEQKTIDTVEGGISFFKARIGRKRVLLVLDDVDDKEQLEAFTADREVRGREAEWFGGGSKIVVTTRNKQVLLDHGLKEEETYELPGLDHDHSVQLFNRHAFVSSQQTAEFGEFTKAAVKAAGGLPLALIVFGSFFRGTKGKREWQTKLEKLKRVQHNGVYDKLKISYDSLDPWEKCIFLDIACLLIGRKTVYPVYMWESFEYFPDISLEVLQHKSLVKINADGEFEMHDQIRDMGRRIVREEGNFEPTKYSRLWDKDDISQVLNAAEVSSGNHYLRGFDMRGVDYRQRLNWNTIAAMPNLQMIDNPSSFEFQEAEIRLPGNTRWLRWTDCPMKTLSFYNNQHEQLVVLDLYHSDFRELRSRNMAFPKLKVLDLSSCPYLIHTPDFTHLPCLEKLLLDFCDSLAEIDDSIGYAQKLIHLSTSDCSLKGLPTRLCELTSLEILNVDGCDNVESLPIQVGNLKSLRYLNLVSTSLTEIPDSLGGLESLEELKLSFCNGISFLPKQIGDLKSLRLLDLASTSITEIPDSIGGLESLEELKLCFCNGISFLPKQIGDLKSLRLLDLASTSITEIPDSIGGLESLEKLDLEGCSSLRRLTDSIGGLQSLSQLILRKCGTLEQLPDSINMLTSLITLDLSGCELFREIPESIGNLTGLSSLCLMHCHSLEVLPESIGSLQCLEELHIYGGMKLKKVPDFIGKLKNLRKLHLRDIVEIPDLIIGLLQLKTLSVKVCPELMSLPQLPSSLESLQVLSCDALKELPNLSNLKDLTEFLLGGCEGLNDLLGLENLKSLRQLILINCDNLGCDLMSKLSKASFENLVGVLISGTLVGSDLLFGFPKENISFLQGYICLTEESLVDSTLGINIYIQVLADGKIVYEGSRKARKIEASNFLYCLGLKVEDKEDVAYCLGQKDKVMYRIQFVEDDEIRKYVLEGHVMVRVPTIYDGYQLNMGYFCN